MANNHGLSWGTIVTFVVTAVAGVLWLDDRFDRLDDIDKSLEAITAKLAPPANKPSEDLVASSPVESPAPAEPVSSVEPAPELESCALWDADESTILVGQTVEGMLDESDDQLEDETYVDSWILPVCEDGPITIEMRSETLDSYLVLLSLPQGEIAADDDGGTGFDARVMADLETGLYIIAANTTASALFGDPTGSYTLSVRRGDG